MFFFFFLTGLFPWHESDGPAARFSGASYTLQASTGRVAAGGSALHVQTHSHYCCVLHKWQHQLIMTRRELRIWFEVGGFDFV